MQATNNTKTNTGTNNTNKVEEIKFPREFSSVIWVRRKPIPGLLPGIDPNDANLKLGSSFRGNSVLRGLTFEEEIRWLPEILGVSPESQNWEKETRAYWANITKFVPIGDGLELEVGLKYKKKEDYETDNISAKDWAGVALSNPKGEPVNLADYILWRYCLVYSRVANTYEDINKTPKIEFYIFSKEKEVRDKKFTLDLKKQATQLMYTNIGDRDWVHYVLRMLIALDKDDRKKHSVRSLASMGEDEKDVILDEYLTTNPGRFLEIGSDKELETKAFVELAIAVGKLTRVPNTDVILHDGRTIGNSLPQAVAYLNNPENAEFKNTLKAQIKLAP